MSTQQTPVTKSAGDRLMAILIGREEGSRCEHDWGFTEPAADHDDYSVKCLICGADRHA